MRLAVTLRTFLTSTLLAVVGFVLISTVVFAQGTQFTAEELAQFDGKDGRKAYTAYEGKVYDVTDSKLWKMGEHFGLQAGKDLTADMVNAPHGPEVFATFTQVGTLVGAAATDATNSEQPVTEEILGDDPSVPAAEKAAWSGMAEDGADELSTQPWYAGRIRFLNISILGWTGIFLGVFFVLTFATCFAMPWAKLRLPWTGARPGHDALDTAETHLPWTAVHKYFVWFTVVLGIIHGVLGLLQMFGVYV